jgi:amino-acid N-acetyltransferase
MLRMNDVTPVPFETRDEADVRKLLEAAQLPIRDLSAEMLKHFLVVRLDGVVVGAAGIENHGNVALLRSVVVDAIRRGTGLGNRLVIEIEARAKASGIDHLYLLTTTAEKFFSARGYQAVPREQAPAAIRGTSEFSQLCPASSVFMGKSLR